MARVFISHRGKDSDQAEKLAIELRERGHEVRLDVWDLELGDSIVGWMNDSLAEATYLLLCLSATGVLAPWISREWMSALARQLNGANIRLIPVRLTGGERPAIIADLQCADLVADWAGGIARIDKALRR